MAYYLAANRRGDKIVAQLQVNTEQLKREASQAQFEALKNQVNPHFLFNSLSILSDRFIVTIGPKIKSIDVSNIAYFFYEEKTTYLTTKDGQNLVIDYSLGKANSLLDPRQFFRVNQAYLVALTAIESIYTYSGSKLKIDLLPLPRHEVFLSPDRLSNFKTWLGK